MATNNYGAPGKGAFSINAGALGIGNIGFADSNWTSLATSADTEATITLGKETLSEEKLEFLNILIDEISNNPEYKSLFAAVNTTIAMRKLGYKK